MNPETRIQELEAQVHDLEKDLIHDKLTGLKTRTFLEEELEVYLSVLAGNKDGKRKDWFGFKNLSLIFFDIDHFKLVNDTHGHDVGDVVLKKVAEILKKNLRAGDTLARWGGEEMVASLIGANSDDALIKAEQIRRDVETATFPEVDNLKVTISAGVASVENGLALQDLVKRADEALYMAKADGRNKVVAYGD